MQVLPCSQGTSTSAGGRLPHRLSSSARQRCISGRCLADADGPSSSCSTSNSSTSSDAFLPRRSMLQAAAIGLVALSAPVQRASAYAGLDYKEEMKRRRKKIPESDFLEGPNGLKYYDIIDGEGAEAAVGQRVAVHYDVKFRNVTFITSRQGLGVTGGTPVGFNVGVEYGEAGSTLPGIDLGIRGMRVGGLRRLLVPPQLAYGDRGVGEIPGGATLVIDVELLSIKSSPLGFRTKLVEG